MKTRSYSLNTAVNESGRSKYENGTRRPPHRQNMFGSEKHENVIGPPRYRQKGVRAQKA
jgi:hypothetical protein